MSKDFTGSLTREFEKLMSGLRMLRDLSKLQEEIGYNFHDRSLLVEALTHDSLRAYDRHIKNYQRLEFLGDSILQFVISDHLFKKYPTAPEGTLTEDRSRLVCDFTQNQIAEEIGLCAYIYKGKGVGQFRSYGSFVESLIGAVYMDAGGLGGNGLAEAKALIWKLWGFDKYLEGTTLVPECLAPAFLKRNVRTRGGRSWAQNFILDGLRFICMAFVTVVLVLVFAIGICYILEGVLA